MLPQTNERMCTTMGCMAAATTRQRSFRLAGGTLRLLDERAAEYGESSNALAQRLLDESLRLERHPLLRFREGGIAKRLRERDHDVISVGERPDLISAEDETLLALSAAEKRALLTNNVRDFVPIATRWVGEGRTHYGLVLALRRSRNTIGAYARAINRLLRTTPRRTRCWSRSGF
jgi:hypothetical protein